MTNYALENWFTDRTILSSDRGNGYESLLRDALGADAVLFFEYGDGYEGDWSAVVTDGERIGLVNGYFGSCSGCDALDAISNGERRLEQLRDLLTEYLQAVRTFTSWVELRAYLEGLEEESWEFREHREKIHELALVEMPLSARDIYDRLLRDQSGLARTEAAVMASALHR